MTPLVGLGDECLLWHVTEPRSVVVRVAPRWRSAAELAWAYRVAAALQVHVPEVVTPLSTRILDWRGHPVTIWPYVPGRQLSRDDPAHRAAAAALLARLHIAAFAVEKPGPRPPSGPGGPAEWPRSRCAPKLTDPALDSVLTQRGRAWAAIEDAPRGPVHGDFYRRNIHVHEGRLAIVDWDEASVDVLAAELAWAVWEFGHSGHEMDVHRAAAFLADYRRAGGPPYPQDLIVPWIRARLRREIL